jgi:hypothetical protein
MQQFALIRFLSVEEGNTRKMRPIPEPHQEGRPYVCPAWIKGDDPKDCWSLAVWMQSSMNHQTHYLMRVQPLVPDAPFVSGAEFELREDGRNAVAVGRIVPTA